MISIKNVIFGLNVFISETASMTQLHRHSDIQIGFYEKGPVKYQLGGQIYIINAKEYVMFWSDNPHMVRYTPENNIQRWLTIPLPLFIQWNFSDNITNAVLSGKMLIAHEDEYNAVDAVLFPQWYKDLESEDESDKDLVISAFENRFKRFARQFEKQMYNAEAQAYSDKSLFSEIYQYIQKKFTSKIAIDDIGKHFNVHPNYAMSVFKKKSGYTINQIIILMRIHEAQRLLISSDLAIIDIAYEAGFSSLSNFYAIFKKQCGITPSEYRENPYHPDLKRIKKTVSQQKNSQDIINIS